MLNAKIKAVLAAALAAAVFGAGWAVRDLQADAAELARLEAEERTGTLLRQLADDINRNTGEAIRAIRVTNTTIHQKAIHEVQRETIYADCPVPASGRVLHREARDAANARIPALPASTPASR